MRDRRVSGTLGSLFRVPMVTTVIIYFQAHSRTMPLLANAKYLMILWLSNFKLCFVTALCNSVITAIGLNERLIG